MYPVKAALTNWRKVALIMVGLMGATLVSVLSLAQVSVLVEIEQALLSGKWSVVKEKCGPTEKLGSAPEIRAIKGHACLLLNQNDESLGLFLSVTKEADRAAWKDWTGKFAQKNPASPVALYLKGDALARLDDWEGAVAAFSAALDKDSKFYPALNARGVARCAQGKWAEGKKDLEAAVQLSGKFADAQASLGTYWLMNRGQDRAQENFAKALSISHSFALARNGEGCAFFMQGPRNKGFEKAGAAFQAAGQQMLLPVTVVDVDLMNLAIIDTMSKATLCFQDKDFTDWPGLKKDIQDSSGMLHSYFVGISLPNEANRTIQDKFNGILEDQNFYANNKVKIQKCFTQAKDKNYLSAIKKTIQDTEEIWKTKPAELHIKDKAAIRGLNRGILEVCYPGKIRKSGKTEGGMYITQRGGILWDTYDQKSKLSTDQLLRGLTTMEYVGKPLASALSLIPGVGGFLAGLGEGYLDNQISMNKGLITAKNPELGGVSAELKMVMFFKKDAWKPVNWFGLLYNVAPRRDKDA